jgi:hypothetical protein
VTRTIGVPTVTSAANVRPTGSRRTRTLGAPSVAVRRPQSLVHTRGQGLPKLSARSTPAGLVHARALGHPSAKPLTLAPASLDRSGAQLSVRSTPAGLVHARALGAVHASGAGGVATLLVTPKTVTLANGVEVPNASRYVIDTTGLWTNDTPAGDAPPGTTLTLNGAAPPSPNAQPTHASPVVTWLLHIEEAATIALGSYYSATLDPVFTFAPYTALQSETAPTFNSLWCGGPYVGDSDGPYQSPNKLLGYQDVMDLTPPTVLTVTTTAGSPVISSSVPTAAGMKNGYYRLDGAGTAGADAYVQVKTVDSSSQLTLIAPVPTRVVGATMTPLSLTSVVCALCPGDSGWTTGSTVTADHRDEANWSDGWAPADLPTGGIDLLGNVSWEPRSLLYPYSIPSEWTAPVVVKNADLVAEIATLSSPLSTSGGDITSLPTTQCQSPIGATACTITLDDGAGHTQTWTTSGATAFHATAITVAADTPTFNFPAGTSVELAWPEYKRSVNQYLLWPNGVTINPATGDFTASARLVNQGVTVGQNSNVEEDQGPAGSVIGRGLASSPYGVQNVYQPVSLGVGLSSLFIDAISPTPWDQQLCIIKERQIGHAAWGDGTPWIVPAGTVRGTPTYTGTTTTVSSTGMIDSSASFPTASGGLANKGVMIGNSVAVIASNTATAITLNAAGWQGGTPSSGTYRIGTPWSTTLPVAPYGVPTLPDNVTPNPPYTGGWIRFWRFFPQTTVRGTPYTNVFRCTTEGNAFAIPGNTPLYNRDFSIANPGDGPFDPQAGQVPGPVGKYTAADLTADISSSDRSIPVGPFAYQTFRSGGAPSGYLLIDQEIIKYSSFTGSHAAGGTCTIPADGRGWLGTTPASHSTGALVAGPLDIPVFSPGINCGPPTYPLAVRAHPARIAASLAAVILAGTDGTG